MAGLSQHPAEQPVSSPCITILYASHTGNGKEIALNLADIVRTQGLSPRILSSADYKTRDLQKEQLLILIISTHGEGEPPETALDLHRFIFSKRAPQLNNFNFSIFALGDSSYDYFLPGRT